MKPEHLDWLDRIWAILDQATQECMGASAHARLRTLLLPIASVDSAAPPTPT